MEKEISSGTMLGIVLIALAAVIGLGFGVFSISKGVANEGTVGVQDNLGAVSDSAFDDYNDKIVTGSMLKSAVQNFKGKSVAILINTTAMDKDVSIYTEHKKPLVIKMKDGTTTTATKEFADKSIGTAGSGVHHYINYNAILKFPSSIVQKTDDKTSNTLQLKDGIYNANALPFDLDGTGKVAFDYSTGGMTRTGNCEYVNPTAKFDANLIKDETGTSIGIVFTQRAQ